MSSSQKGGKMKLGVGNEHQPFKSTVSYFSYWRRGLQQRERYNGLSTSRLYLCDQKQQSRAQIRSPPKQKEPKSLIFGRQSPFAHLDLIDYMQVVPEHTHSCVLHD